MIAAAKPTTEKPAEATRLRDISRTQWKSGIAAWLGWFFDGLELHLYTLVATPLIAGLLHVANNDPQVKEKGSFVQAAFLVGWALGGAFFGWLGDKLGRSKTLALTVLTYAICTGLCTFAQNWWQLMIFRFIAALGIGGEWAVGASLIAETWPKAWRPWLAAVLQSGVNLGIIFGSIVVYFLFSLPTPPAERYVFLIGVLPAVLVFWIRKNVPEPEGWQHAHAGAAKPSIGDLFRGSVWRVTGICTVVCALSLSAWWLFLYWHAQHLRAVLGAAGTDAAEITRKVTFAFFLMIGISIIGNYFAGWLAKKLGNRRAIVVLFVLLFGAMLGAFVVPRGFGELAYFWVPLTGFFSGVFGLFTMYLPPLFPTLLRTTGAGFCFNIGRLAAAAAAVIFGVFAPVGDIRTALLVSSFVALAAAICALKLPEREAEG